MSQTIPNHVPMSQFSVRASQLLIGEKSLDEIAVMLGKDVFMPTIQPSLIKKYSNSDRICRTG